MISLQVTVLAASAVLCLFILRHIIILRKYPSAPGPRLALLSRHWYAWEVWKGKFETWNMEQHRIHGKVIRVAPDMYTIDDLEAMKRIYGVASDMPKSDWYAVWSSNGRKGDNLFSMEDRHIHGQMRRKVASMYSMSTIKQYEPYVDKCNRVLMQQFEKLEAAGQAFDLQSWMQSYAFDVIGEITFSSSVGFMEAGAKDIDNIIKLLDSLNSFSTIIGIDRGLFPLLYAKFRIPSAGLLTWVAKLSQLRRQSIGKQAPGTIQDFHSKVDALKEKDPEGALLYNVDNTLIQNVAAGSDTTSITLTAILFHLANNPTIMKKLRSEIMTAITDGGISSPITFDESQRLPYLANVIKEGMRLHPAVGLPLWRVVQEPGLTLADKFFPPGVGLPFKRTISSQ